MEENMGLQPFELVFEDFRRCLNNDCEHCSHYNERDCVYNLMSCALPYLEAYKTLALMISVAAEAMGC